MASMRMCLLMWCLSIAAFVAGCGDDNGGKVPSGADTGTGSALEEDSSSEGLDDTDSAVHSCEGLQCYDPPAAECESSMTAMAHHPIGWCEGGECQYKDVSVDCTPGNCSAGVCEQKPCQGVVCLDGAPPICSDANTAVVYNRAGSCSPNGSVPQCIYNPAEKSCDDGACVDGQCSNNACLTTSCNQPPARHCEGTRLVVHSNPGRCSEGECYYERHEFNCGASQCGSGKCGGELACALVDCLSPPAAFCWDADTLRTFDNPGTCDGGDCIYGLHDRHCDSGCSNGQCADDPCVGVACVAPPSSYCLDENTLNSWDGMPGSCDPSSGGCGYNLFQTSCSAGCTAGECNFDPCAGLACSSPPADYCIDATHLRTHIEHGVCYEGFCLYPEVDAECEQGCGLGACETNGVLTFEDVTEAAGLQDLRGFAPSLQGGVGNRVSVAFADYNNDGYMDFFTRYYGLYQNDGSGAFVKDNAIDDTALNPDSGLARSSHWGDLNNDGNMDLLTTFHSYSTYNFQLYLNDGLGAFTPLDGGTAGYSSPNPNVGDAFFIDFNKDSYLDILGYKDSTEGNLMFFGRSDETFERDTDGVLDLGPVSNNEEMVTGGDIDNDGDIDIVHQGGMSNDTFLHLMRNDLGTTLTHVSDTAGVSTLCVKDVCTSTIADYDNDGYLDIFHSYTGANKLFKNEHLLIPGTFTDVAAEAGLANDDGVTVDAEFGDLNNDGYLDLVIVSSPLARIYLNKGDGTFEDVTFEHQMFGDYYPGTVGFADVDNDGDLDIFFSNARESVLFQNNVNNDSYLKVHAVGLAAHSPRDATGSRIELWNGDQTERLAIREISGGTGAGRHPPHIQHFGLSQSWGGASGTYTVVVRFTSGLVNTVSSVIPADVTTTIGSTVVPQMLQVLETKP